MQCLKRTGWNATKQTNVTGRDEESEHVCSSLWRTDGGMWAETKWRTIPRYSPGMPVRVIKQWGAKMGAEQKRRDCVKSSWEGKTWESRVLHRGRDRLFHFCDRALMRVRNEISDSGENQIFRNVQRWMRGESRTNAESEPAAEFNESKKLDTSGPTWAPVTSGFSSY